MSRRGIIDRLEDLLGTRSRLRAQIAGYAVSGVLQGFSIATLIPMLRAVVGGDLKGAFGWIGAGIVAFLAASIALAWTARRGYRIGVFTVAEGLTRHLSEHVAKLPLGWFTAARAGRFSTLIADAQAAGASPPWCCNRPPWR